MSSQRNKPIDYNQADYVVDDVNLTIECLKCKLKRPFNGNADDGGRWKICAFQRHVRTVHQSKASQNPSLNLGKILTKFKIYKPSSHNI